MFVYFYYRTFLSFISFNIRITYPNYLICVDFSLSQTTVYYKIYKVSFDSFLWYSTLYILFNSVHILFMFSRLTVNFPQRLSLQRSYFRQ